MAACERNPRHTVGLLPLSLSLMMLSLLMLLHGPVGVSPITDMQQCPRSLYDCTTLEATLTGVADVILMPDFVSSVLDDFQVDEICRFLKTPICSESVLAECKGEVVYASGAVKARIQYVCGNRQARKGMQELKTCYHKFARHFHHCRNQRSKKLSLQAPYTSDQHPWCNLTQEYILCVYSIMALGCTIGVAEEYMATVNMSYPVVQAILGFGCSFGHPLDILSTTSTVSVLTSAPMRGSDPSRDRPALRSGASSLLWSSFTWSSLTWSSYASSSCAASNAFTAVLSVLLSTQMCGDFEKSRARLCVVFVNYFALCVIGGFLSQLDTS